MCVCDPAETTQGNEWVQILGKNFGPSVDTLTSVSYVDTVQVGSPWYFVDVRTCNMTVPHEVLQCVTVPGAGSQLSWTIVVAGQVSTNPTTGWVPIAHNPFCAAMFGGSHVCRRLLVGWSL